LWFGLLFGGLSGGCGQNQEKTFTKPCPWKRWKNVLMINLARRARKAWRRPSDRLIAGII
jgi:hypothetical protein